MKKIVALILAAVTLMSFAACGSISVFDAKDQKFSTSGMTITLTSAFEEAEFEGYTACFDSIQVAVFVIKEEFTLVEGFEDCTVEEYAEMVREANADKDPSEIFEEDGLTCMEYTALNEEENVNYKYLSVMFKGPDAFWLVQFVCDTDIYEDNKPEFLKAAASVVFDE